MRVTIKPAGMAVFVAVLGVGAFVITGLGRKSAESAAPGSPGVAVAANFGGGAAAPLANGLIANGDFEGSFMKAVPETKNPAASISGQYGEAWFDNSSWGPVALKYDKETKGCRSGSGCQKITITRTEGIGQLQFNQSVDFKSGKTYLVRAWMKASKPTEVQWAVRESGKKMFGYSPVKLGSKWEEVKVRVKVSAKDRSFLMLICKTPGATIWLDDVSAVEEAG